MFENLRTTKGLALITVFAAFHTVLSSLPYTITIGVSGSITLGVISSPLIGILLGPITGGIAVLIGSVIAMFINPAGAIFGFASFLPATLGAISAGFTIKKQGYISAAIIAIFISAFYVHPFGMKAIFYPFLHIIAIIIALIFSTRLAVWSTEMSNIKKLGLGIPIAAFVGTLTDHMVGGSLAIWIFDLQAEIWNSIIFIYPIERIVAVIITSAIALPLYYSLKRSGIFTLIDLENN
ncbi:MAG: hypothetical protein QCH99_04195 [Candidatus Bathyarchaeota archaeon]|nr:hypothetical protein [Candidatus Bathyarchaeum tardum]WGM90624.1 MAG: hypothetical protein NUK63_05760 [Candidatus Bathyarchaeum tardum]